MPYKQMRLTIMFSLFILAQCALLVSVQKPLRLWPIFKRHVLFICVILKRLKTTGMQIKMSVNIQAPAEKVWEVITDFENAHNTISAIQKTEVLHKPAEGLVGLKWKETRLMFGKEAAEVMWITEAEAPRFYTMQAESRGLVYTSGFTVEEEGASSTKLTMQFTADASNALAKIVSGIMGVITKRAMRKAVLQDLTDIKKAVESKA